MNNWLNQYIGCPYDATSIAGYNCWSFVRKVLFEQFGQVAPMVPIDMVPIDMVDIDADDTRACITMIGKHEQSSSFIRLSQPIEGAIVTLGRSKYPSHVGVWSDIDGGGVIHCQKASGVVYQSVAALERLRWNICGFYRVAGND